jgi:tetratricopeptide (TPR) repeat protein
MPPADRAWLVFRECQFLLSEEKFHEVADLAASQADQAGSELRQLQVLALLKAGDTAKALDRLEVWRRQHPGEEVLITCLQAQAFRRAGRLDEMARCLDRASSLAPRDPAVALYSVSERFEAGQRGLAGEALNGLLNRFGVGQNQALVEAAMGSFADIGYAEGMDRLLDFALDARLPVKQLLLSKIMYHLTEAESEQARRLLIMLNGFWDTEKPRDRTLQDFFKLLLEAATDPGTAAQLRFANFCGEQRLEWDDFLRAAKVLDKSHQEGTALRVLDVAIERFPSSYHLGALHRKIQGEVEAKTAKQK